MNSLLLRFYDYWTVIHTKDPLRLRKGRLLAVILGSFMAPLLTITAINIVKYFHLHTQEYAWYLCLDGISLSLYGILWWVNRRGRTFLASYYFLGSMVVIITLGFSMEVLDRTLLAFAIPILAASFLIKPHTSLFIAAFSILGYSLRYFYENTGTPFNIISVAALIIIAVIAWIAALQLEHALDESSRQHAILSESQVHDRILFEESPIALWEEDYSRVKSYLDELRSQGVSDFQTYLEDHPDVRRRCESMVTILDANHAALKMSGYETLKELQTSPILVLQRSPLENAMIIEELTAIANGKYLFESESPNDVVNGKIRFHHLEFAVVPGHEHDFSKLIVSIQDITERVENEQTLRFQSELLSQIGDLIFATDLQGIITYVNDAFCNLYQSTCQKMIGENIAIFGGNPENGVTQQEIIDTTLAEGTWSGEMVTHLPDGSSAILFTRTWLLRDEKGYPSGICSISTNISAHKQMENKLIEAQKMAGVGVLAAGVAHEINSPLQIITGLSGSILRRLEQGTPDLERLRRNVDDISRSSWRVAEIVRSLLAYSRASSGNFEPTDLNNLVKESLVLIESLLRSESGILISTLLASELPPVSCNRSEITQVLINLMTNARDAMPHGGQITIHTHHDFVENEVLVEVSDTGQGISPENLERIFNPFFTTKPANKATGLGLSICQRIIRTHGGEINVSSTPGQGATFTIHLPLVPPTPDKTLLQEDVSLLS